MEKEPSIIRRLPRILGEYAQSDPALFCMPAHKGRGLAFFRDELAKWDVKASWLRRQGDPVRDIALRYSRFYRTAYSFLLTGGEASALRVMLRVLPQEEKVIIPEGSGGNMAAALAQSCRKASVIRTGIDPVTERFCMPEPNQIAEALDRTGAGAVFLRSPDTFGFCADIRGIAETVHSRGALLLVDASFGPHFQASDQLPDSAALYADMVCHCPYTGMNALNQAAVIHLNPCRIDPETLGRMTEEEDPDPSSLILASMDWAIHTASPNAWDSHLKYLSVFTDKVDGIPGLSTERGCALKGAAAHDASRILIDVSGRHMTGCSALQYLEERNILAECADKRRVLLVTSPEDDPNWYERILNALAEMPEGTAKAKAACNLNGQTVEKIDE